MVTAEIREKIRGVITAYSQDFEKIDQEERYKWRAVGWFQQHWNLPYESFAERLRISFGKAKNLLASSQYFPLAALIELAEAQPQTAERLFSMLLDETLPLEMRFQAYRDGVRAYFQPLGKSHYQDLRAVMAYLTFAYPERYFFYKYTMDRDFRKKIGWVLSLPKHAAGTYRAAAFQEMCETVLEELQGNAALLRRHRARLEQDCYQDSALHLLTMDVIYYGSRKEHEYWPDPGTYDPGISRRQWQEILANSEITTPAVRAVLQHFLDQGGRSTCAHLAAVYGETDKYYNAICTNFAKKVKEYAGCPDCPPLEYDAEERNRVYVIPFVGRYVQEGKHKRYEWKLRKALQGALMEEKQTDIALNTILYGPPGTGKTYHAVTYAVAILENRQLASVLQEPREEVVARFRNYQSEGRVESVTFHQSYGYEDFIEGYRPELQDKQINYVCHAGVFKSFCSRAENDRAGTRDLGIRPDAAVWKVSLERTGDNETRRDCMEHGYIRIGWDDYGEELPQDGSYCQGGKTVLSAFYDRMQLGDVVLSCYSATTIDAIGVIVGEPEWLDGARYPLYRRCRKVRWLVKEIREDILERNGGISMTLATVYQLSRLHRSDVEAMLEKYGVLPKYREKRNYVFLIDEINRGNISKIFGDLLTLLEESKRKGREEAMEVRLPGSGERFSVPDNLYVLGTMNTADRSIALLDTALRRRFQFREMTPDSAWLEDIQVEGIEISVLLTTLNRRIEALYDRDHTIGHTYFLPLQEEPTLECLGEIFLHQILPLLQEYFYEDYEKIRLVLGDNQKQERAAQFIEKEIPKPLALFGTADVDVQPRYIVQESACFTQAAYQYLV